jgi:hypothetical protein
MKPPASEGPFCPLRPIPAGIWAEIKLSADEPEDET